MFKYTALCSIAFAPFLLFNTSFAAGDGRMDSIIVRYDLNDKPSMLLAYIAQAMLEDAGYAADVYSIEGPEQLDVNHYSGEDIQVVSSKNMDEWSKKHKVHPTGLHEHVGWWMPKYMSYLCEPSSAETTKSKSCLLDLKRLPPSALIYADLAGRTSQDRMDIGYPCISPGNDDRTIIYTTEAAIRAQTIQAIRKKQPILVEARSFGNIAMHERGIWVRFKNRNERNCSYKNMYFIVIPAWVDPSLSDVIRRIHISHDEFMVMLAELGTTPPNKVAKRYVENRQ